MMVMFCDAYMRFQDDPKQITDTLICEPHCSMVLLRPISMSRFIDIFVVVDVHSIIILFSHHAMASREHSIRREDLTHLHKWFPLSGLAFSSLLIKLQ